MKIRILPLMMLLMMLCLILLSGCAAPAQTPVEPRALTVMTHDSFAVSEAVISAFEKENNAKVTILPSGDAGTALNKAILSKNNPIADVLYGVDNTFLSRAISEDIFEAYASPQLANIPDAFKLDPQERALPVDYGDVCLNFDEAYFADKNLAPPQTLEDLTKPEYKGLTVVENPATSSPGLSFLLATIGHFGADQYLDYWRALRANDLRVVNDWNTAYYTEFTRAGGSRPIVLSYSSSPVFELLYAEPPAAGTPAPQMNEPPTGVIASDGACFRQIEFAGILKGAKNRDLAEKWIDFMLSPTFQEDMPLQMYVFPVNTLAKLNETFTRYLVNPTNPAIVDAQEIAANREKWMQAWTEAVLR